MPCCLEWPQAVSGILMPAATDNQPSRISGCFVTALLWSVRLKQLHAM